MVSDDRYWTTIDLTAVAALDLIIARHVIVALEGALELPFPIPTDSPGGALRASLNLGWRF